MHNTAPVGGGIASDSGAASLTNTTLAANASSTRGGGLAVAGGTATLQFCTVSDNNAPGGSGGGIARTGGTVTLAGTIVAGNAAAAKPDVDGAITSSGYNILGSTTGAIYTAQPTDKPNTDPQLGPLQDNGGTTMTMAPRVGPVFSPAIDAGPSDTARYPATDERGGSRAQDANGDGVYQSDIGAVEAPAAWYVSPAGTDSGTGRGRSPSVPLQTIGAAFRAAYPNPPPNDGVERPRAIVLLPGVYAERLRLTANITIAGCGGSLSRIDGGQAGSTVTVDPAVVVNLMDLGIVNGRAEDPLPYGGGLMNQGNTTLTRCLVSGNTAFAGGGVSHLAGTLTLKDSTFENNQATIGGGIENESDLVMTGCTLNDNAAPRSGDVEIGLGGGLANVGAATLTNDTFALNSATMGGGIHQQDGSLSIAHCTISGNTAAEGGGIFSLGGTLFRASILAGNTAAQGADGSGAAVSIGYNYVGIVDPGRFQFLNNGDYMGSLASPRPSPLLPLGDYGGPTRTMMPLVNKTGVVNFGPSLRYPHLDQRGFVRPLDPFGGLFQGLRPDIGAVEAEPPVVVAGVSLSGASPYTAGASVTVTVSLAAVAPASGAQVSVSSPALSTVTVIVPANSMTGSASVRITAIATNVQATATGVAGATGTVQSAPFSVIGTPEVYLSETGDDANSGTTAASPVLTLAAAWSRIAANGNIYVAPGHYPGSLLVDRSVTIQNAGDRPAEIQSTAGATLAVGSGVNLVLVSMTISGATGFQGGIRNQGTTVMAGCTVYNNSGGGIINMGTLQMVNCTVSGNLSQFAGGGIANLGQAALANCTIAGNYADQGGGGGVDNPFGFLEAINTIFANNLIGTGAVVDFQGTLTSDGYNLLSSIQQTGIVGTTTGNLLGVQAQLGPLQDNGGPVFTRALLPNSPAINAGVSIGAAQTDARGVARPQGNAPDIGAFEFYLGTNPYTMAEAAEALKIAAGFKSASLLSIQRLNVEQTGSPFSIDVRDAELIARKVAGKAPNP